MDGWVRQPASQPASQPDALHEVLPNLTCSLPTAYHTVWRQHHPPTPYQPPPVTTTIRQVIGSIKEVIRIFFSSLVLAWLTSTLSRCSHCAALPTCALAPRTYSTSTVPYRIKSLVAFSFSHLASDVLKFAATAEFNHTRIVRTLRYSYSYSALR
ncbi:hypothetical protein B9Z19DRAFT_821885 [Tuber borchii]|uniref:Uncharacterized protein n=1 Tax=Tuber borchii TaxID=42251 RepID=A0A2T7A789_TUBBO|nr:hypothetical protein B9Z19DRAFT_821885 [Tuber borchii]